MTRVFDILAQARRVLHDKEKTRWSDEVLLSLLDEAQKDICRETNMLRDLLALRLKQNVHTYTLPADTLVVYRTEYDGEKLPLRTTEWMDDKGRPEVILKSFSYSSQTLSLANRWQTQTTNANILCAIFDKLNRRQLRVWPTPISDNIAALSTELETPYGITTSLGGQVIPGFGVVSLLRSNNKEIYYDNYYGVLTSIVEQDILFVRRSRLPTTVKTVHDELEIDIFCDTALKYYVIGQAFKDDIKEENRAVGNDNLRRYYEELHAMSLLVAGDSVQMSHYEVHYNGMG